MKPESLEDFSALNALYRPGPLDGGMVDDYIERRHGRRKVTYFVPQMKEILENTYGILVYQEQIMQLAQKLAGYSLGEADLMRRAMGKKKKEEMAKHEDKFVDGAVRMRHCQRKSRKNLFPDGAVCRLWIQSLALFCVCLSGLSNGLLESELSRRISTPQC